MAIGQITTSLLHAALNHPLALKVKPRVRSVWWGVKGRGTQNPSPPGSVRSILFVCLGNICRSPFAAALTRRLLDEASAGDVRCSSAGIHPSQALCSPPEACEASAAYGVALQRHAPQPLTHELLASHDLVFVMERSQLELLRSSYPALHNRLFLLSLYDDRATDAYARYNIVDPFGQPLWAYEICYERIERCIRCWVADMGTRLS